MALPAPDRGADAAVMALVIVFVPDPAKGVAEMMRAVKPGGLVSAYMWDLPGNGFPFQHVYDAIEEQGLAPLKPPSWDVSALEPLTELWRSAGLGGVESRAITVERSFPDFEALWSVVLTGPRLATVSDAITPDMREKIRARLRERVGAADGRPITLTARAHAVKGRVPG